MSPLNQNLAGQLAAQRKAAQRALGQGRRWYLRAVLLMVIAVVAVYRGGQINRFVGITMVVLAGVSASMGRGLRRGAADTLAKIDLMEHTTSEHLGELGG